ncbi:MAG: WSC domain-containing protein [Desulfuromonadales bacterium]
MRIVLLTCAAVSLAVTAYAGPPNPLDFGDIVIDGLRNSTEPPVREESEPRRMPHQSHQTPSARGAQYLGCYKDEGRRDLKDKEWNDERMTPERCISSCRSGGYAYAGLQYSSYCFCGDRYGKYGQISENSCSMACSGDSDLNCGGSWANSVFKVFAGSAPSAAPPSTGTSATYLGCYKDESRRDLKEKHWSNSRMTPELCVNFCRKEGFMYAGAQNGSQCFCGDRYGKYGQIAERSCSSACSGDSDLNCGGSWANSVFQLR